MPSRNFILAVEKETESLSPEKPPLEIPEMNNFMGNSYLVNLCIEIFEFSANIFYFCVLCAVKSSVSDKMPYFLKFSRIEPNAMRTTFIYDDPRYFCEVFPVHQFAASYTRYILNRVS